MLNLITASTWILVKTFHFLYERHLLGDDLKAVRVLAEIAAPSGTKNGERKSALVICFSEKIAGSPRPKWERPHQKANKYEANGGDVVKLRQRVALRQRRPPLSSPSSSASRRAHLTRPPRGFIPHKAKGLLPRFLRHRRAWRTRAARRLSAKASASSGSSPTARRSARSAQEAQEAQEAKFFAQFAWFFVVVKSACNSGLS